MTDNHKVLRFPAPPPVDQEEVVGIDITAITEDILNAARLAALDVAAERLTGQRARPHEPAAPPAPRKPEDP